MVGRVGLCLDYCRASCYYRGHPASRAVTHPLEEDTMAYPSPDFNRLLSVFRRDRLPDRVPFYEFFHDKEIVSAVLGAVVVRPELDSPRALLEPFFRQRAEFLRRLGYDYVNCMIGPNLHITHLEAADTAGLARDKRGWIDESHGLIETWADYEAYPW